MAVIEYIKRNQRMGFEGDKLVYKVPVDSAPPVITEEVPVSEPELSLEEV